MDKVVNSYKLYRDGKYDQCERLLENLRTDSSLCSSQSDIQFIWNCIYTNNALLCKSLRIVISNEEISYEEWLRLVDKFISDYQMQKNVPIYPLQLKLTLLYNGLFAYWMIHSFCRLSSTTVALGLLTRLNSYLNDVVRLCEISYIEYDMDDADSTATLLNALSKYVSSSNINMVQSLIIIDLIHIVLLLVEFEVINQDERIKFQSYVPFLYRFIQQHLQTIMSMKQDGDGCENDCLSNTNSMINVSSRMGYFKFGWKSINSELDNRHFNLSVSSICATIIRYCFMYVSDNYALTTEYYQKVEKLQLEFSLLFLYIKALVYYRLKRYEECKRTINQKIMTAEIGNELLSAHMLLLRAMVCSKISDEHEQAFDNFNQLITDSNISLHCRNVALYHYIKLASETQPATAIHLVSLQQLSEQLSHKHEPDRTNYKRVDFESTYLQLLHRKDSITAYDIKHMIALSYLQAEDYDKAADCYENLLKLVHEDATANNNCSINFRLMYYEAVLANILAANYTLAESICHTLIDRYISHTNHYHEQEEEDNTSMACLYQMEQDVIATMLLSDIHAHRKQYDAQMRTLNECYNVVFEYFLPIPDSMESSNSRNFCRMLMSNILRRKADLCLQRGLHQEASQHLSKACTYDKDCGLQEFTALKFQNYVINHILKTRPLATLAQGSSSSNLTKRYVTSFDQNITNDNSYVNNDDDDDIEFSVDDLYED